MNEKTIDETLRRNIWRSLLIMRSAALSELPAVVSGLSYRKARSLMRDLEVHGYVTKTLRHRRQEYSQDSNEPSLPPICKNCGRSFASKVCGPKPEKKQKERQTETETETPKPRKKRRNRMTASDVVTRAIREGSHDAA